jgi:hypothetical protein
LAGDIDNTSSIHLAKFIITSICFGIDRAIFAYKDMDLMWKNLEHEWEDLHLMFQVQAPNIRLNLPHLPKIWDIFDQFFGDSKYNSFFYQKEVVDPPRLETQEEKILFPKPISTRVNRGYLAPPEVNTSFPSFSNPSWSEQERNFHPVSPMNRGNYRFSDYSRDLKDRKGVRISGEKSIASDIFYPDVCYMAPNLAGVRDEGFQSDLRE